MGLIALLAALVVGAGAAAILPLFSFMITLSAVFIVGSAAAVVICPGTMVALESAVALFASAQIGYALGLAARARIGITPDRPRSPSARRRRS